MSYLNDTSVVSQFTKPIPDKASMTWLSSANPERMYLSVMTVLEIRLGIAGMSAGKRRTSLTSWLEVDLPRRYEHRILAITTEIADDAGSLIAKCHAGGYNIESIDAFIASTARVHGFAVVTLNRKHFRLLDVPMVQF